MSAVSGASGEKKETQVTRSLRKFVEGLTDPTLLVSGGNLRILYANAEARVRYSNSDLTDHAMFEQFIREAFPEANQQEIRETFVSLGQQTDPDPAMVFLHNGAKQTHLRITSLDFEDDCQCGGVESIYAVTLADPDFDAIMRRLEFVLDSTTDGIFIVNRTNHIVYFNKACEKITGWRRDLAVMQTYECANVLRCHNDEGESMGSESLCPAKVFFHKDSMPKPHEMLITTTAGKERYVETNYSPIKNPAGEVEFIVGIIRDIDQRKRLEDQVVQNRNLVMLGSLVSGIAHEIKNPLGILMSSVEIVLNENRPEEQRREAASYIKDEVRRLDERMKYFLAFAKPKPLMREPVDVTDVIRKVASTYQSAVRNNKFHVQPPMCSHLPMTLADPDLLHQVFLNLIINAEQASPKGGVLSITADQMDDWLRIRFIDNGCGIQADELSKIFDPFYTTKSDGTGLGLSIVHQIITSHHGKISAKANENKPGLTVEILLPVTEAN
jgi:nitrogen-specific signal transduction histidine kinase